MTENEKDRSTLQDKQIMAQLEAYTGKAEKLLNEADQVERILQRLEAKLKEIPALGEALSEIPVLISLIRSYIRKEYALLPVASATAILAALLYFISPVDLIPDMVPFAGYIDDALVLTLCLKIVSADVDEYRHWREENGKAMDPVEPLDTAAFEAEDEKQEEE